MGCDFAVDTSLSWEGVFPKPGRGDYLVTLGDIHKGNAQVLISRRYTSADDYENAADIALDAFSERQGYKKNDEGELLTIDVPGFGAGWSSFITGSSKPCWIERVDKVL
jgi:hypothetical protein